MVGTFEQQCHRKTNIATSQYNKTGKHMAEYLINKLQHMTEENLLDIEQAKTEGRKGQSDFTAFTPQRRLRLPPMPFHWDSAAHAMIPLPRPKKYCPATCVP